MIDLRPPNQLSYLVVTEKKMEFWESVTRTETLFTRRIALCVLSVPREESIACRVECPHNASVGEERRASPLFDAGLFPSRK
ncbi:hypothetical protein ElyMa_005198600 [Elysia marginata]|uniref:Uncharacterized protein n=1 Tax=Elysia marginata TaxID=1093978 RepID=A0AAV4JW73_9GAST|nr:hypothetical protein ElyMa_005198600 [Elysia marginata]